MSEQANKGKNKYTVVAEVLKHKSGDGHYVKVKQDIKAGTILQVQDPRQVLDMFIERGIVTAEEGEERRKKIVDFLSAQLVLKTAN